MAIMMSRGELTRLQVLIDVANKRWPIDDEAPLIGVTRRQAYRLLDVYFDGVARRGWCRSAAADRSFTWRVERTVTNTLTVQYDRVLFILEPSAITRSLARKEVSVFDYPNGHIEIRHQGLALHYCTFDRVSWIDQGRSARISGSAPTSRCVVSFRRRCRRSGAVRPPHDVRLRLIIGSACPPSNILNGENL